MADNEPLPTAAPDRTTDGPVPDGCAEQPVPVLHRKTAVPTWPLLILALPAAIAVWSGWVGIGEMTGFGEIRPLPGIWNSFHLDTAVTLPVGVEAYAAFALHAWLTSSRAVSDRTRCFARWSAIAAMILGMSGQVAYHLLNQAGTSRAPWEVTTLVACLPVAVLGMGSALAHRLRSDATTAKVQEADAYQRHTAVAAEQVPASHAGQGQATPSPSVIVAPSALRTGPGSRLPDCAAGSLNRAPGHIQAAQDRLPARVRLGDTEAVPPQGGGVACRHAGEDVGRTSRRGGERHFTAARDRLAHRDDVVEINAQPAHRPHRKIEQRQVHVHVEMQNTCGPQNVHPAANGGCRRRGRRHQLLDRCPAVIAQRVEHPTADIVHSWRCPDRSRDMHGELRDLVLIKRPVLGERLASATVEDVQHLVSAHIKHVPIAWQRFEQKRPHCLRTQRRRFRCLPSRD
jgi:hypothetical protein